MPARVLQPADDAAIVTFWNTKANIAWADMGLPTFTLTREILNQERASGRVRWVGGFRAGVMIAIMQTITNRLKPEHVYIPALAFDPTSALTDAQIDAVLSEMSTVNAALIPDGWTIQVFGVPATATVARRFCDAHYSTIRDDDTRRSYSAPIAVFR